jgi:hypothetical protein
MTSVRLLALGALFGIGGLAAIAVTPSRPASATPSAISGIGLLNYGGHLSSFTHDSLYHVVVGDAWDSDASVLASVPGQGLAYFSGADVNTHFSTGVPYSQASANGWLLKNSAGNLLVNTGYPANYIGDIGSSGYQQAWITNVENYLAARPGIDGVFIDDVNYDPKSLCGGYPEKYPSTSGWSAAEVSFQKAVYTALHAKGYYVALNASGYIPGDSNSDNGNNTITFWKEVGPYADGLMNEYYNEAANGTNQLRVTGTAWYQQWDAWQRLIPTAQSMGDDFIGLEKGGPSDTAAMTYGKSSFLLEWNGGGGTFMYAATDGSDPTNSAWTTSIGQPAGSKLQVGVGWMRLYSGGVVLVNPSPTSAQMFSLGGAYTTPSGASVTSVTLQPGTGMILTGGTPPNTTTTTTTTTATVGTTTTPVTATTTTATTTTATVGTTTTPVTTTTTTSTTTTTTKGSGHRKRKGRRMAG